ncbi:glycerol-3-phosphate acyltransferase [Thermodesulfobacteriota bacterium]
MKPLILVFIGAYLAGSINFAILLFKILGKDDPRTRFSGNPGVFNVYRQSGYFWAAAVLLLDLGRALGVALISTGLLRLELVPWAGLGLLLGNRLPCFHGFRGGKGVANYLGFTTIISPIAAGLSALGWLLTYAISRTPFIGSFVMVFILGAGTVAACDYYPLAVAGVSATVALIYYNHKRNVSGLLKKSIGGN